MTASLISFDQIIQLSHSIIVSSGEIMSFVKKCLLTGFTLLVCHAAQAEMVELDSSNAEVCRQTLLTKQLNDQSPIILIYSKNEPRKQLVKNYEAAAQQYPAHIFFKYNIDRASITSFRDCLGYVIERYAESGIIERITRLQTKEKKTYVTNSVAAISGLELTEDDISKFIESGDKIKSISTFRMD
jgi:hypothetical protein